MTLHCRLVMVDRMKCTSITRARGHIRTHGSSLLHIKDRRLKESYCTQIIQMRELTSISLLILKKPSLSATTVGLDAPTAMIAPCTKPLHIINLALHLTNTIPSAIHTVHSREKTHLASWKDSIELIDPKHTQIG